MMYQIYITILLTAIIIWSGYFIGTKAGIGDYADNFFEEYILPTIVGLLIFIAAGGLLAIISAGVFTIVGVFFK